MLSRKLRENALLGETTLDAEVGFVVNAVSVVTEIVYYYQS